MAAPVFEIPANAFSTFFPRIVFNPSKSDLLLFTTHHLHSGHVSDDLYFDGEKVAQSVQVPGLSTKYQLSVMARTDAIGNAYSVTVDNFKVYRAKGKRK